VAGHITQVKQLSEEQRATILRIAAKHGARNVRIFGSVARGEARRDSDLDLLVDRDTQTSPWFPAGLVLELESVLGRKVDVVTEGGLSPHLREQVLHEARPL
jgi:uncharacterized protein